MYILVVIILLYKTYQVTSQCSQMCKNNACDQVSGECTAGCIDGYYSKLGVCYEGPYMERCVKCENSTRCIECTPGKRGTTCQWICQSGCKDNICDINSGICSLGSCESGFYFSQNTRKCSPCQTLRCSSCSNWYSCDTCTSDQYWGSYCQFNCNTNCASGCNISSGCSTCQTGYYKNGYGCSRCLDRCSSCTSASVCISCKPGFVNGDIYSKCECEVNVCIARAGGNCMQCPSPGWYPNGNACCPCHSNCKGGVCFSNGTCTECMDGNFWHYCQYICNSNCADKLCHRDGSCIACQDTSKFGKYCNYLCNKNISRCSACLQQEDSSVDCMKCIEGYYVDINQCKPCSSNCKTENFPVCNSTTGSCNYGCKEGFVGEKCDTSCGVGNCQSCSAGNASVCSLCMDTFYLKNVTTCVECPAHCKTGRRCDAFKGTCMDGCSDSWSGQQCNQQCPQGCINCDQFNSSSCSICNFGFYGDACEKNCSSQCQYKDDVQICNKNNGQCNFGCNDGFWDYKCLAECGPGCNRSLCNITTGACIYGCISDYYGEGCKERCSIHCMETETLSGRICDELNGHCLKGCTLGWFGETCSGKCSDQCNGTVCNRNNGTCTFGCVDGNTGIKCLQDDSQQEYGYQNLMLNTLNRPSGSGSDNPATTSISDSNIEVYQELNQRIPPENTYSALSASSNSNTNITSNVDIDTAAYQNTATYQNTAVYTEASTTSDYQELGPDVNSSVEYCSILNM